MAIVRKAAPKAAQVFVGRTFSWAYTENWKLFVDIAKRLRLKFDPSAKNWAVPSFAAAVDLVKCLLEVLPNEQILVTDFDTYAPVAAARYITPAYLTDRYREQRGLGVRLPLGLRLEGAEAFLSMPLSDDGKASPDHAIYHGLAEVGCQGRWEKGKGFRLKTRIREAVDFLRRDGKVPITGGVPWIPETPFLCETYDRIFPHQEEGVTFLYHRPRALLADDMGLGKTAQALIAAEALRLEGRADALLILCPVTLIDNWRKEMKQWEIGFKNVHVIPYSRLKGLSELSLSHRGKGLVVIADEAHYLKNPASQRTKSILMFEAMIPDCEALWLLSGTPVTKDFSNLWSLASLLQHPIAEQYGVSELAGIKQQEILKLSGSLKTVMLGRKKGEVLNLPEKMRQTKIVSAGMQAYLNIKMLEILADGKDEEAMEHLMTMKRLTAEAKVDETIALARAVLDEGRKVVLFSEHSRPIAKLVAAFPGEHVLIDGSTPAKWRQPAVEKFQSDPACRVFIGNVRAAGVGITLTAAQDVIFNDLTWLPSDIMQAEDRCHRIGAKGTVSVTYMVDPELILDEILAGKLAMRSAEIATFEQSKASVLKEIRQWAKAKLAQSRTARMVGVG